MNLLTILLISSCFLINGDDFEGSGIEQGLLPIDLLIPELKSESITEESRLFPIDLLIPELKSESITESKFKSTTEEPYRYTAKIGQFVVEDDENKQRICTCSESSRCSFANFDNSTRDACSNDCHSYLSEIDTNSTALTECFNEGLVKEMEIGDICIRGSFQNLCSNSMTEKKASIENWGLHSLQFDSPVNPLHSSNVFMTKASNVYSSLRKFQHCFNNCYRQKEKVCRDQLRCAVNYPTESEIEETLNECPELKEIFVDHARVACKCMIYKKKVVKLLDLCTLFNDQILSRVN